MGLAEIQALKEAAKLPKPPKIYKLRKVSLKKQAILGAANGVRIEGQKSDLEKWYGEIMEKEEAKCWETGEKIDKRDKRGWHGSIAHILPKNIFESVQTHPQNYMILKMWGGVHGQYDSSWENAAKMRIWPYACKMFNILYPLLTREEKAKLPDIIIQEIKPETYNAKNKIPHAKDN